MEENSCIFCKIIKKEISCTKIYEDENFLAFLDIQPVSDGHTLIIPKKHIVWMQEADDETISEIFKLTKKLMLATKNGVKCDYVQVSIVGKDVPHFHIHLIPRYLKDKLSMFPTKKYKDKESTEVAKKITQEL
ncbi:MAG: HIT domain-containing protein [bacterium]